MLLPPFFAEKLHQLTPKLLSYIDNFSQAKILVIGDLTLDEFITGITERISREAPVLILRHEQTKQVPGGGANAVYNLAKLGANVKVVGLIGDDIQGQSLKNIFDNANIDTTGIFIDPQRPTVTKTRISGHSRQSVTQQIVRIDRKSDHFPDHNIQLQLADYIKSQINQVDAVVCSDYNEGVFTDTVIQAALLHTLTIVDSQKNINRYQGATIFTPNLPEAEQEVGYSLTTSESLLKGGKDLLNITQSQQMLITRGDEGMSLFDIYGNIDHIPAFNRTDVFDVTGAGDTVVSALTLGLCAGASPLESAILGNLAASIVVRQFSTATTTPDEMKSALLTLLES